MTASAVRPQPIPIDQVNVTGGTNALSLTNVSGAGAINVSNANFTNTTRRRGADHPGHRHR